MPERNFTIEAKGFKGYKSRVDFLEPEYLAPPSVNCFIEQDGVVRRRKGHTLVGIDLSEVVPGRIYAQDNGVKWIFSGNLHYVDGLLDTGTAIDTGISISDTKTDADFFANDLYYTNTTDGLHHIVTMRLNGAVSSGAGTITVDLDGAARLSVFSLTTGTIYINGTAHAYNAVNVGTGVITFNATTAQDDYADNTIVFVHNDISSGREKASIIKFWTERMVLAGSVVPTNSDDPKNTLFFSKFALPYAAAGTIVLDNIIDFTYGTTGSTRQMVGSKGAVTCLLDAQDFFYVFKESEMYYIDKATINASTGQSVTKSMGQNFGALNKDSAVHIGNGDIVVLTSNKQIVKLRTDTKSGAPISTIDNNFDNDIKELLDAMDNDQTDAYLFFDGKKLYAQVFIDAEAIMAVYDTEIGKWQPPIKNWAFNYMVSDKDSLYATDIVSDSIYKLFDSENDDVDNIECYIATGVFDINDAFFDECHVKGEISLPTTININFDVDGSYSDTKQILGTSYSYGTGNTYGSFPMGADTYGGLASSEDIAKYEKLLDIYPSEGSKIQMILSSFGDSSYFGVKSYTIKGRQVQEHSPLS